MKLSQLQLGGTALRSYWRAKKHFQAHLHEGVFSSEPPIYLLFRDVLGWVPKRS